MYVRDNPSLLSVQFRGFSVCLSNVVFNAVVQYRQVSLHLSSSHRLQYRQVLLYLSSVVNSSLLSVQFRDITLGIFLILR